MIKAITKIEVTIENRVYQLLCEGDSPIPHIKEAMFQISKILGAVEDQINKAQAEAANQEKPPEQPSETPKEPDLPQVG